MELDFSAWVLDSGAAFEELPEDSMEARGGACSTQAAVCRARSGVLKPIGLHQLIAPDIEAVLLVVEQAGRWYQPQRYLRILSLDLAQEQLHRYGDISSRNF